MKDKRWLDVHCYNQNGYKIVYHEINERKADNEFKMARVYANPFELCMRFEWDDMDFIDGQNELLDLLKKKQFNVCVILDNNDFIWSS
jgi:hypothetical protein